MPMLNLYAKPGYKMGLWKRIKWWFRRAKYARQRAHWGFSEWDIWDFAEYHAELVSKVMEYWAEHNMSYHPDMTNEEWQATLRKIGECFAFWNKELPTPAYDAWREATKRKRNADGSIIVEAPDEIIHAWHEEELANQELRKQKLKEGFDLLLKYYPHLWD